MDKPLDSGATVGRLTVHGLLSIGSQAVWGVQGFVTFLIAARLLPRKEVGFIVAANAILFGCQCLILGPVTNPTLRLGAISGKPLRVTYGIYCAVTAVVCSAFLLFARQLGRLVYADPAFVVLIRYLSVTFAATTFYAVQKLILFAKMRYGTALAMDIVFTVTNVAALLFLYAGSTLTSAVGFYMARSAAALAGLVPAAFLYFRTKTAVAPEPAFHYKDYFSHSKYSTLATFSGYGQNQVDALAVAHFLDPLRAAAYGAAKVFYTGIALVTTGLIMVVLPAASRIAFAREGGMHELYRKSLVTAYALLAPACALLAIFAAPVLRICFGNRYPDAAPLIRIFCLASLAMPLSSITDAVANGAGWWRSACAAAVAGGIVGASASLCLTPAFGASGAALAPVLGIGCTALVLVSLTWKRLGESRAWGQVPAAVEPVGAAK